MSKAVSITMNFSTASARTGGGEVSNVFKGIVKDARRTGQEVTKSLNVRTEPLIRNLQAVEKALQRVQNLAKAGKLAEIIKAADAVSRAEVQAAQRAAREKEKLAAASVKRAQKVADDEAREAARLHREKVKHANATARDEAKAAQAAERDKTRIRVAEMQAANRLEVEKLKAAEAAERAKVRATERAETDRRRAAERAARDAQNAQRSADSAAANTPGRGQMAAQGMQQAGGAMVAAGTTLTATLTVPLAAFAAYALDVGTKYDEAMNMLQVATSATSEQMELAARKAIDLGADMTLPATSAANAAAAMLELGKAGMTIEQSMEAARGVLQLSAAANIDEARAAEIAANALNSFGLAASESTRVSDLLAASANASSAEITDVAAAMQQSSAVFASAKVPIEDLSTLIAIMANNGIKGSDAGTSLKTMLMRLQAPTKDAAAQMKKLGVDVFDAKGKLIPFREIVTQFSGSLSKLNDEQKAQALQTIFGADAMRAATIIFGKGTEAYDKMKDAVTKQGAAAEMAAARTKGLGGAWEGLKSQVETFALLVYNQFKGPVEVAVRAVAEVIGNLGERFNAFAQAHPQLVLLAGAFAALVAAVGPALVVLGGVVMAIGGIVGSVLAVKAAVVAVGGVAAALVLAAKVIIPLVAVLALVAAAAVALYLAWQQNLGGIREFTYEVVGGIRSAFSTGLQFVRDLWAKYGANIMAVAAATWNAVASVVRTVVAEVVTFARENFGILVAWVKENWPLIQQTVQTVLEAVGNYIRFQLGIIAAFWRQHGETIKAVVSAAWTIIKTVVQAAMRNVLDAIKLVMQLMQGAWAGAWETFKGIAARGVATTLAVLRTLGSLAVTLLRGMVRAIVALAAEFLNAGLRIATSIVDGIVNGIKNGVSRVVGAAKSLASAAVSTVTSTLIIRSPSRVFYGIGQMVAMGFVLGIGSMQAEADAALKRLVIPKEVQTVSGKGSAKVNHARKAADKINRPGFDLAKSLYDEFDSIVPDGQKTKLHQVQIELTAEKYRNLRADIRANILAWAEEIDKKRALVSANDSLNNQLDAAAKKLLDFKYSAKEGASEVEKFDLWLAQLRAESPLAAAALDQAADKIAKVREAWAAVDAEEKARKTREATEQLTKAVAELADESGVALRNLSTVGDTHLEKFIEKFSKLKNLSLELSALNPVKDLAASIRSLPPEERLQKIAEALERIMRAAGARPAGMSDADWKTFIDNAAKGIDNSAQVDEAERRAKALDTYNKALEDLSGKLAEVNGQTETNNKLTEAARIQQELLRGAYKDLTDEQKRALVERAREIDQRRLEIEEAEKQRQKLEELADSLTGIFDRALDDLFEHGFKGFFSSVVQGFKQMFQQIVKDFLLSGISKIIRGAFGLDTGTASGTTSGGGGILSTIGNLFGGLFGGGGGGSRVPIVPTFPTSGSGIPFLNVAPGSGIASVFGPSLASFGGGSGSGASTLTQQVANQTFSASARSGSRSLGGLLGNAGSLFKGIGFNARPGTGGALASMLPLLGAGLGQGLVGSLAGPQAGGLANVLGMVGGGLVGVGLTATPAIFAAGGSLSALAGPMGALFSNPITAVIGGALLLGGVLLGRQRQRRADEHTRDASMTGSLKQLNDLLKAVNAYPGDGGIPVKDALEAAGQVRAEYMAMANGLKDSKARRHAQIDVSRLDAVIAEIRAAGAGQKARETMVNERRPEFDKGGVIPGRPGQPVEMIGHGGEVVVNWNQLSGIGAAVMALAGVPGLGALPNFSVPTVRPANDNGAGRGGERGGDIYVDELRVSLDAESIFVRGGRSRDGRNLIIGTVREENYEQGLD